MAVLEKIRVKFGVLITILVAVALLSFIIDPSTLSSARQMLSSDNKVGEMAGKNISYRDFYKEYDRYSNIMEITGQRTNDEEAQNAIRDMAWQALFDENVFLPMAGKAGISVGDQEMLDLTQGNNISPILLQQGVFRDDNGNFQPGLVSDFIQSIDDDPSGAAAAYWNFVEDNVYKTQVYSKYNSMLASGTVLNKVETERAVADNNRTADVDYIFVPASGQVAPADIPASEVSAFYNARKALSTQPANRDIEYVMFEVQPSQGDIEDIRNTFNDLYEEFKTTDNIKSFIALNSDEKWDTYYYKEGQITPAGIPVDDVVSGGISEVVESPDAFKAARLVASAQVSDSAFVTFAAVPLTQETKADSLLNAAHKGATGEDFSEIGWITQEFATSAGVPEFAEILKAGPRAIKVKNLNSGAWFVLYAKERTKPANKHQLATLAKNIYPSESTYRDFLMAATEFADKSGGKYENFAKVASEENLPVVPINNVVEATRRIGPCENARELVRWVFEKRVKKGSVSDVIIVDNKYYFVAAVTETRKEGIVPLSEVEQDIRMNLAAEKSAKAAAVEIAAKISGCSTIEEAADALDAVISHQGGVSFGSLYSVLDPALVGAVANAEQGKLSGPVAGSGGAYLFSVTTGETGTFFTEQDAHNNALQSARIGVNMLPAVLNETAKVKDYRPRFF